MESNGVHEPGCGNCKHWHKRPADPRNLAKIDGDCRALPPQIVVMPQGVLAMFPVTPPNFAACGQYAPRVALDLSSDF